MFLPFCYHKLYM